MSIILTEEDFQKAAREAKTKKLSPEQKEKLEELGRKMRSLSAEERRQLVLKAEEDKLLK